MLCPEVKGPYKTRLEVCLGPEADLAGSVPWAHPEEAGAAPPFAGISHVTGL